MRLIFIFNRSFKITVIKSTSPFLLNLNASPTSTNAARQKETRRPRGQRRRRQSQQGSARANQGAQEATNYPDKSSRTMCVYSHEEDVQHVPTASSCAPSSADSAALCDSGGHQPWKDWSRRSELLACHSAPRCFSTAWRAPPNMAPERLG